MDPDETQPGHVRNCCLARIEAWSLIGWPKRVSSSHDEPEVPGDRSNLPTDVAIAVGPRQHVGQRGQKDCSGIGTPGLRDQTPAHTDHCSAHKNRFDQQAAQQRDR